MAATAASQYVDVLIVGGGPTALITAYVLLKFGAQVLVVEQYDKTEQALYGRACMLYARSLEILDQLGLFDRIADIGYIIRDATTFKDGQEVSARGWTFVQNAIKGNTHFDFSFSIRQKYIEDALRAAIAEIAPGAIHAPARLVDYSVESSSTAYPVSANIQDKGKPAVVHCKYLVGADGGRSTVRSLSRIPFPGTKSQHRWVRLDAIVRTNMPSSRQGGVSIESREHGNVLWTPTDNGRTRIGFVFPDELYGQKGENVTAQTVMDEARKAVRPFELEFVQLDWWTVYEVGQRVAETFRDGPVFLAGDAAHTHSSGAAQGMNTGIHDATNLAWKLAGVLKGLYIDTILDTYTLERRASAQHLIQLDRDVASLISGKIPSHFNAPPDADVNIYLDQVFSVNASFTVGLGISYAENVLNSVAGVSSIRRSGTSILVGHRGPDAIVFRPGTVCPRRLHELMAYVSRFHVLVFAGALHSNHGASCLIPPSAEKYKRFQQAATAHDAFTYTLAPAFNFITIMLGSDASQTAEALGEQPLGKAVYDRTGDAFEKYYVDAAEGGIVVLRPDGIVGFETSLDGWDALADYFRGFVCPLSRPDETQQRVVIRALGEISLEDHQEKVKYSSLL